jgi:hypothetical protein
MQLKIDSALKPTDDITWRNVDQEVVVLKLESGEYFTFNDLGREIWLDLVEGLSLSAIIEKVAQTYDVEVKQAEADVTRFASGLLQKGLLAQA